VTEVKTVGVKAIIPVTKAISGGCARTRRGALSIERSFRCLSGEVGQR